MSVRPIPVALTGSRTKYPEVFAGLDNEGVDIASIPEDLQWGHVERFATAVHEGSGGLQVQVPDPSYHVPAGIVAIVWAEEVTTELRDLIVQSWDVASR